MEILDRQKLRNQPANLPHHSTNFQAAAQTKFPRHMIEYSSNEQFPLTISKH